MLKIENLVIEKSGGKRILNGINTEFEEGKLNAVMGPNGTGKSTLLDAIYGKSTGVCNVAGKILFKDQEREIKTWNSLISYVEQEPFFVKNQTARDLITFSIKMKNAADNTDYKLEDFQEMIEAFNIHKILDTQEDLLSGGERKRVMLAIEIVQKKSILLLDEPVSDLDSHLAMKALIYLRSIARRYNTIVVLTIHQPSEQIYKQLDNLLFIYNGITVYSGNTSDVSSVLESHGIVKPNNWSMAEFLFEAFYNSCIFPEISVLRPAVEEYIKKCNMAALSVSHSLKSYGVIQTTYNFTVNLAQSSLILYRSTTMSLKRKRFYVNLLMGYSIYFYLFHIFVKTILRLGLPLSLVKDEIDIREYKKFLFSSLNDKEIKYITGYFENQLVNSILSAYFILTYFSFDMLEYSKQLKKEIFKGFYTPSTLCISVILNELSMELFDIGFVCFLSLFENISDLITAGSWIRIVICMLSMRIFKTFLDILFASESKIAGLFSFIKNIVFFIIAFEFKTIILNLIRNYSRGLGWCVDKIFQAISFIYPPVFTKRLMLLERIKLAKSTGENSGIFSDLQQIELSQNINQTNVKLFDMKSMDFEIKKTMMCLSFSFILLFFVFSVVLINSFTPKIILKTK